MTGSGFGQGWTYAAEAMDDRERRRRVQSRTREMTGLSALRLKKAATCPMV